MAMPPFAHMAAVRADARTMQAAQQLLRTVMAASVQQHGLPEHVNQFGPVPMLMARLAGYERAQVFLESRSRRDLHRAVSWWQTALLAEAKSHPHIRWLIDVDPVEL
jgi:primosomal protein N' (replication factor Y)